MARPQHRRGCLLSAPLLLLATVFLLLALMHPTQAATYSRNPLARAVHKTGKAMQRRVQAAKGNKYQQQQRKQRKDENEEDENLVTSMQVDVEETATQRGGGRGRRNRHRIVRHLQQIDAETEGVEEDGEKDSGATPAAPVPEPMKITLDMNFKDMVKGGNGDITPAFLEGEATADIPAPQQHRTLILGVALGGGILLLALAFVFVRKAYLRRQEEEQQQQQQQQQQLAGTGATLEASPKKKRPGELNSVTGAGGVGGPSSPTAGAGERSLSGRLAGERAAAGNSSNPKKKIMVREESRIDSSRAPNTGRGDFFQLKEIDLGVQSPGRGGPGSKVFSPRG